MSLSPALAPLYFTVYGLSDQVGQLLAILQNRLHAVLGALWEPCRNLFVVDLFSAHERNIDDITYCYKGQNNRYHLFTNLRYLISSITSERSKQMIFIDENTSRADLEIAAIFECNFDLTKIEAASDEELRNMILDWIEAGDECAAI